MKQRHLGACALLPLFASSAYAASADQVFTLGEVVVSADAGKATVGSTSIDSEEMRRFDTNNVGTALNLIPGTSLTKSGARNELMMSVRGFDLRQVPIYADGIPVYVPYDGYVDLSRFTTYDLSRIEVSKGFSSALYGANTLGGAINLVSRRPSKPFEGEAGGGIVFGDRGGISGQQAYANVGTNQGMWYMQAGVSYVNQDFSLMSRDFRPVPAEDGGKRERSNHRDRKVNVKFGLTPNTTDEYVISYMKQEGEKSTPPYTGRLTSVRYWDWPYWDKESVAFLSKTEFGNHTLRLRLYHDSFENSLVQYRNASFTQLHPTNRPSAYDDYTKGFSIQDDIRIGSSNVLKVAYNYKLDVHRESAIGGPRQNFKDKTQTIAVEDTHEVTDRITLAGGLSYEKREGKTAQDLIGGVLTPFNLADNNALNAQAAILYKLDSGDQMRFSAARKSRFATIKDRYSYRMGTAIPNPDLKAEHANHFELGYRGKIGSDWTWGGSLFHSRITNMIQSNQLTPTLGQMQNIGKVYVSGVELEMHGRIGAWELGANYTYLDRDNRSDNAFLTDTPRHKAIAYTAWNITPHWRVQGSVESSSRRYSSSDGRQVAPGFAVMNAKASYMFNNGATIEAGVRNLLDRNYMYTEGFPEPGRTFFTQVNVPF